MSYGIDFKADVYLSRQDYGENPILVQDKIDELSHDMNEIIVRLKMYASATIKDIVPEEWMDDSITWLNNQMDELIEQYNEYHTLRDNLYLYLNYLNSIKDVT
jgi:hypothetical protein